MPGLYSIRSLGPGVVTVLPDVTRDKWLHSGGDYKLGAYPLGDIERCAVAGRADNMEPSNIVNNPFVGFISYFASRFAIMKYDADFCHDDSPDNGYGVLMLGKLGARNHQRRKTGQGGSFEWRSAENHGLPHGCPRCCGAVIWGIDGAASVEGVALRATKKTGAVASGLESSSLKMKHYTF